MKVSRRFGCSDAAVLEDLTQDTYLRLCESGFKILRNVHAEQEGGVHGLIKKVAYSVALDHFRRGFAEVHGGKTQTVSLEHLVQELAGVDSPQNQLEKTLFIERADQILDELTAESSRPRDKAIFWLRFRQGYTAQEIARIAALGLQVKGVESLLKRLIDGLRERMR